MKLKLVGLIQYIRGQVFAARLLSVDLLQRIQRHPQRMTALVAAALTCGAGAAFAVAGMSAQQQNATPPSVQHIVESVQPLPLDAQIEELQAYRFDLYRSEHTRSTDTVDSLLTRLGISDASASAFLRKDKLVHQYLLGRKGRSVRAQVDDNQRLIALTVRWVSSEKDYKFQRLVIQRRSESLGGAETASAEFESHLETGELQANTQLASGVIYSSLFASTDSQNIPDSIAIQLAEIFSGDIDFHRNLRKGDRFSVVYESLQADGEPLRVGRILSAEFVNAGKNYQALWFQDGEQSPGYYTADGQSLRRSFLASPVEFSRVTSGFKMRLHPIHQVWRAHLGTDYAAPTGTPVRTVADGVVDFAGVQNGYGNVVVVQHHNGQSTVYAHLSKIHVQKGQRVNQGEHIGAVGATGWATGPHLHFEFKVNGTHRDPMQIARQSQTPAVSATSKERFAQLLTHSRAQWEASVAMAQTNTH